MSASGEPMCIQAVATADLNTGDGTGAQYKAVAIDGTIAANNSAAFGLLQNKPKNGEDMTIAYFGHMKGVAGGALSRGELVRVTTSGYLTTVASGDGCIGKVITAAASGATVEILGNFVTAASSVFAT